MELLQYLSLEVESQLQCDGSAGSQIVHIIDLNKQIRDTNYRERLSQLLSQISSASQSNLCLLCSGVINQQKLTPALIQPNGTELKYLIRLCSGSFQRFVTMASWSINEL